MRESTFDTFHFVMQSEMCPSKTYANVSTSRLRIVIRVLPDPWPDILCQCQARQRPIVFARGRDPGVLHAGDRGVPGQHLVAGGGEMRGKARRQLITVSRFTS